MSDLHFENPDLWSPEYWKDRHLDRQRAQLALERIPAQTRKILDVGCGNGLLARMNQDDRLIIGIDRSITALKHGQGFRCQADAIRLPFANQSFDASACMEMIEHLPHHHLGPALDELDRVTTQQVIITVPYREILKYSQVTCPICGCKFHPYHHVRSFEKADMLSLFPEKSSLVCQEILAIGEILAPRFSLIWDTIRIYYQRRKANFPWYATCPQCGFSPPTPASGNTITSSQSKVHWRDLWPKRKTFKWWLAVYKREASL